jgi:hypothetical protein
VRLFGLTGRDVLAMVQISLVKLSQLRRADYDACANGGSRGIRQAPRRRLRGGFSRWRQRTRSFRWPARTRFGALAGRRTGRGLRELLDIRGAPVARNVADQRNRGGSGASLLDVINISGRGAIWIFVNVIPMPLLSFMTAKMMI